MEQITEKMIIEQKIMALIADLKKQGLPATLGRENPDEKVNVWWVVARLQDILLEGKK